MKKTGYRTFRLSNIGTESTYFLRVDCVKEAYIPIDIRTTEEHYSNKAENNLILGLYYGFVLWVILFNLLAYINTGHKTSLYYIFMLVSITLGFLYKDGISTMIIGNLAVDEVIEKAYNLLLGLSCIVLSTSYLRLDTSLPQIKKYAIGLFALSFVCFLGFAISHLFYLFVATNVFIISLLSLYLGVGIYLFKKSTYAKFFTIAYAGITILGYDFYLSPLFGYHVLDLTLNQFRIGGVVEMLVFTYAITYQSKLISNENQEMRASLLKYTQHLSRNQPASDRPTGGKQRFIEDFDLGHKEMAVLEGISKGKLNKEIADDLHISVNTVKYHIRNIYTKLEIKNRKEATIKYFQITRQFD